MGSQLHQLTFQTLGQMDGGRIAEAFRLALERVLKDCEDRPHVDKARTISIQIAIKPVCAPDDDICDETRMQCVVSDNVPKRQTRLYSLGLRRGGMATFNDESLDDIKQESFGFEDDEQ